MSKRIPLLRCRPGVAVASTHLYREHRVRKGEVEKATAIRDAYLELPDGLRESGAPDLLNQPDLENVLRRTQERIPEVEQAPQRCRTSMTSAADLL